MRSPGRDDRSAAQPQPSIELCGRQFSARALLPLILVCFTLVATYDTFRIPLWEAPDEPMHLAVARDIAAGRLPLQMSKYVGIGEEHQPPLYYVLASPVVGIADGILMPSLGLPFPRGAVAAAYALRLFSVLMGVVTLLCVYFLVESLLDRSRLALLITAVAALTPAFLMTSATANNDNAAIMFSSATTLFSVRAIRSRRQSTRDLLCAGLMTIGALLSKITGMLALITFLATVTALILERRAPRISRGPLLSTAILGSLLMLAYVVISEAGSGQRIKAIVLGQSAVSPQNWKYLFTNISADDVRVFAWDLATSYWGTNGWQTYTPMSDGAYWALAVFATLAALGTILHLVRQDSELGKRSETKVAALILGLALILILLALLTSTTGKGVILSGRTHARYLLPAIGTLSLVLAGGSVALVPQRARVHASLLMLCCLVFLHATATFSGPLQYSGPVTSVRDWSQFETDSPLPVQFDSGVRLTGFAITPDALRPGGTLTVTLLWQADAPQQQDMTAFIHVVDGLGQALAKHDEIPTRHRFPPRLWRPGDLVIEQRALKIPVEASPGSYRLWVGAYSASSGPASPIFARGTNGLFDQTRVNIGELVVRPDQMTAPDATNFTPVQFADSIQLRGVQSDEGVGREGEVRLALFWSANGRPARDYAVSVQVIGPNGLMITQHDAPLGGGLRTSLWSPGEIVSETHVLTIPASAPSGVYSTSVAVYDPVSGMRLRVEQAATEIRDEMVSVGALRIK